MGAGLATLHLIEEEKLDRTSGKTGPALPSKINETCGQFEMFKEVRGKGLMVGIEFKSPKSLKLKAAWAMIHAANKGLFGQMIVVRWMAKHRILTQVAGHNIDLVKLLPPLVVTEEDVSYFAKSLAEVVGELPQIPGGHWETGNDAGEERAGVAEGRRTQRRTRLEPAEDAV
jgi:ornithine--oxo-acid transaminase